MSVINKLQRIVGFFLYLKRHKGYIKYFCYSMIISVIIFSGLYCGMESLKPSDRVEKNHETSLKKTNKIIQSSKKYTNCLGQQEGIRKNYISYCKKEILKQKEAPKVPKKIEVKSYAMYPIFIILILTLSTQLSLLLYIRFEKKSIRYCSFLVSDWAVNSPPIFGVLGTIISFALLMEQTKTIPIEQAFTEGFFDAAITTVIGGCFYSINLFLTVFIHPHIKKNDLD